MGRKPEGDFSFFYDPSWGSYEIVDAPEMTRYMYFNHTHQNGRMMRVYDINVEETWNLLYAGLKGFHQ